MIEVNISTNEENITENDIDIKTIYEDTSAVDNNITTENIWYV